MLTKKEKDIIVKFAKKYDVSSVVLFGSSLDGNAESNDIDIGVKGIQPQLFFKFYGELIKYLTKPVHLVDLSLKTLFNEYIEKIGTPIYG